ncbi:MAG: hypothetical protein OQL27_01335 [Sedimenticola sp.]|nr:hypothetical protein [Sedimenticola sp.]
MNLKKALPVIFIGLIVAFAHLPASYAADDKALNDFKHEIVGLHKDLDRLFVRFQEAFTYEVGILRLRAKEKAQFWRETGLLEGDFSLFERFRGQFANVHMVLGLDFSKVHGAYAILQRQIHGMQIVATGRLYSGEDEKPASGNDKPAITRDASGNRYDMNERINVDSQRNELSHSLLAVYLSALASETPAEGEQEMKAFATVLQNLGDANRDLILDEVTKLQIQEEKMLLELIPLFGDAIGLAETYQGEDIWGKKMTWVDYGLAIMTVFPSVGDAADIAKLTKRFPTKMAQLQSNLASVHRMANKMPPDELRMLAKNYPAEALERMMNVDLHQLLAGSEKVEKINGRKVSELPVIKLTGRQRFDDVVDTANLRAMSLARNAIAEQQSAVSIINNLTEARHSEVLTAATEKLTQSAPALDVRLLANPDQMSTADWDKLRRSMQHLEPARQAELERAIRQPELLPDFIEAETGIPIGSLQIKADAIGEGQYVAYRKANAGGLRLMKRAPDENFIGVVTKHKDIKGKSGPGGLIPFDQEFSKMSAQLDRAEASGTTEEIADIRAAIRKSDRGVRQLLGRGGVSLSTRLEGRDVIAVTRNTNGVNERSLVTRDPISGAFYDIESGLQIDASAITVITSKKGKVKKVPILVDSRGRAYLADADPHIIGTRNSADLVDDSHVNGFITRTEQELIDTQNRALREAGAPVLTQHGAQVRAYGLDLPVDETFYVIEQGGRIRFINQDNLPDLVHYHRLNGTVAPIDPSWQWGGYNANGFEISRGAPQ